MDLDDHATARRPSRRYTGNTYVELRPGPPHVDRPELTHAGVIAGTDMGEFPSGGVDVSVNVDGDPAHHLRLHPGPNSHLTDAGCIVAVVMADLLGATLSRPALSRPS